MSLPRASYLEAWEFDPNRSRPRLPSPRPRDSDGEDSIDNGSGYGNDVSESLLSSSFPSTYSRRLSFNPYAGPGWRESSVDRSSDQQRDGQDDSDAVRPEELEPPRALLKESELDAPLTTGAFEISTEMRIGMFFLHFSSISCGNNPVTC